MRYDALRLSGCEQDRQRGVSYTEISRKYHIDPRTAKKYAQSSTRPVYSLTGFKPLKLDPYKEDEKA